MANMNTHCARKRMARIYSSKLYEISDRYNRKKGTVRKEPTQTVASAIHDMRERGFSTEAIYRDLDDLCITTYVDIDELALRVPVTPLSRFVLCNQ